jgi:hypothetical protein
VILILAHHYDAEAEWLCAALRRQGQSAALLWPEALGVDYAISLFLRSDGQHAGHIRFFGPPSRTVAITDLRYAVNRLGYVAPLIWEHAVSGEREYATSEINAFFSGLIRALPCGVSNPVRNGALWSGAGFEATWLSRLGRHGISIALPERGAAADLAAMLARPDHEAPLRWLHVNRALFSPPGQANYPALERAIGQEDADEMLEFVAIEDPGSSSSPRLVGVTRTPALSCFGPTLVDALIEHTGCDR